MTANLRLDRLPRTVELARAADGAATLAYVDQRLLPGKLAIERTADWGAVVDAIKTLAVRGAPAIGVAGAAALGSGGRRRRHGRGRGFRIPRRARADGRGDRLRAPDRGEPALGGRARAGPRACCARRGRGSCGRGRRPVRGGEAHGGRGRSREPRHRRARSRAAAAGQPRAHALQRRKPGDGVLRHGARRGIRRGRARSSACTPTRRAQWGRARASRRGSWRARAFPARSSATTWPQASWLKERWTP